MKSGDRIERVFWPRYEISQESLCETPCQTLHIEEQCCGDHSEWWVVLTRDGIEVARHNTRFLESIVWKAPPDEAPATPAKGGFI